MRQGLILSSVYGGLGNALFAYHNASVIARAENAKLVFERSQSLSEFLGDRTAGFPRIAFQAARGLSQLAPGRNHERVGGRLSFLPKPLLGDIFFDLVELDGAEVLDTLRGAASRFLDATDATCSGDRVVHLRGGDFRSWDMNAVRTIRQIEESVLDSIESDGPKPLAVVCADENDSRLGQLNEALGVFDPTFHLGRPWQVDFAHMLQASEIHAGPSTFAIWASLLGDARIHYCRSILEARPARDLFFSAVRNGKVGGLFNCRIVDA